MKYLFTVILLTASSWTFAQQDYQSYIDKGVKSLEDGKYDIAIETFSKAKKDFKSQDEDDKKDEFKALEKQAKVLGKIGTALSKANERISQKRFKDAQKDIRSGQKKIKKAKKGSHEKLVSIVEKLETQLSDMFESSENNRNQFIASELQKAKELFTSEDYESAIKSFNEVKRNLNDKHERKQYDITNWIKKANSGKSYVAANKRFDKREYYSAYKMYNEMKDPMFIRLAADRKKIAQTKECTKADKPIKEIYNLRNEKFNRFNSISKNCDCPGGLKARYANVAKAKKNVKQAEKLASKDPLKASAKYQKAYNLTKIVSLRTKAEKLAGG